jgi:hypothetical protein
MSHSIFEALRPQGARAVTHSPGHSHALVQNPFESLRGADTVPVTHSPGHSHALVESPFSADESEK